MQLAKAVGKAPVKPLAKKAAPEKKGVNYAQLALDKMGKTVANNANKKPRRYKPGSKSLFVITAISA